LSLVVSYDDGGTADCNDVAMFDKVSTGIEDYDFASVGMYWYDSIEDLNGDGRNELIVDGILAAPLGGGHCWATWPIVYTWNGTGYADVSAEFRGFYRKTLTNLQGQIAPPSPSPNPEQHVFTEGELNGANGERLGARVIRPQPVAASTPRIAQDTDCQAAEEAKIERVVGISGDAGIDDAVKWSESDDPIVRKFGATIPSDIGTREAIEDLRTLSSDQDPNVARSGKADLKCFNTNTGPVARPTIEGELIPYPLAK